jgi:hypothetical protein
MFILDDLMIGGISWALKTVITAAEAEMNDDTALREQLMAAEMQREMGEITDDDFAEIERDLLGRIREIKERREGGSGPLAFGEGEPIDTGGDGRFQIEATVSGDFHDPADAPHTTIVEEAHTHPGIIGTAHGQSEQVLDVEPIRVEAVDKPALPLPSRRKRAPASKPRTSRKVSTARASRTGRPARAARTSRTASRRTKIR